jgi:hypothetical protein
MGLFDSLFDLPLQVLGAAAKLVGLPADVLKEIAKRVDPDDDAAIRTAANIAGVPFDALKAAIRKVRKE